MAATGHREDLTALQIARDVPLRRPVMATVKNAPQAVETRIGTLEFTHDFANGYPTDETVEKLYDERDFQRACQAYLWSLPAVSCAAWQRSITKGLGAKNGQIVAILSLEARRGILTANATTPYYLGFADLSAGPLVLQIPAHGVQGGLSDAWQNGLPDSEAPARYLVVGPGQNVPDDVAGYAVRPSPTFNIFLGVRLTDPDPQSAKKALAQLQHLFPCDVAAAGPGKGQTLQAGLAPDEDPHRRRAGGRGDGEGNSADRRFAGSKYRPDAHRDFALQLDADDPAAFWNLLDERASWFYEAVGAASGMAPERPGPSSAYLGAYKDKAGQWLDGGTSYHLRIPPIHRSSCSTSRPKPTSTGLGPCPISSRSRCEQRRHDRPPPQSQGCVGPAASGRERAQRVARADRRQRIRARLDVRRRLGGADADAGKILGVTIAIEE
jgi:hypothetical protein